MPCALNRDQFQNGHFATHPAESLPYPNHSKRASVATSASGQRCEPFRDGVAGATVTLCCLKPRPSLPPSVTGWMKCETVLTDMLSAARTRYLGVMQQAHTRSD